MHRVATVHARDNQASIFICPINKHKDIISMNNVQGQAARKAHKAQHCWPTTNDVTTQPIPISASFTKVK